MSQINISTSLVNDTILDSNLALIRKLNANKLNLSLDLNSICKYIQFKIEHGDLTRIHFRDDIFKRKDAKLLLRYLEKLKDIEIEIDITLDTYYKIKKNTVRPRNVILNLKLTTVIYERYVEIHEECELDESQFQEAIRDSLLDNQVKYEVPLIVQNIEYLNSTLNYISKSGKVPILKLPRCNSYQEYSLNSIFPSRQELVRTILSIGEIEIPRVIVSDIPICMLLQEGSTPSIIQYQQSKECGSVLSVEGIYEVENELTKKYVQIELCKTCRQVENCKGLPFQFKI